MNSKISNLIKYLVKNSFLDEADFISKFAKFETAEEVKSNFPELYEKFFDPSKNINYVGQIFLQINKYIENGILKKERLDSLDSFNDLTIELKNIKAKIKEEESMFKGKEDLSDEMKKYIISNGISKDELNFVYEIETRGNHELTDALTEIKRLKDKSNKARALLPKEKLKNLKPIHEYKNLDEATMVISNLANESQSESETARKLNKYYKYIYDGIEIEGEDYSTYTNVRKGHAKRTSKIIYDDGEWMVVHSKSMEAAQFWEKAAVIPKKSGPDFRTCTSRIGDGVEGWDAENFWNSYSRYNIFQVIKSRNDNYNNFGKETSEKESDNSYMMTLAFDRNAMVDTRGNKTLKEPYLLEGGSNSVNAADDPIDEKDIIEILGEERWKNISEKIISRIYGYPGYKYFINLLYDIADEEQSMKNYGISKDTDRLIRLKNFLSDSNFEDQFKAKTEDYYKLDAESIETYCYEIFTRMDSSSGFSRARRVLEKIEGLKEFFKPYLKERIFEMFDVSFDMINPYNYYTRDILFQTGIPEVSNFYKYLDFNFEETILSALQSLSKQEIIEFVSSANNQSSTFFRSLIISKFDIELAELGHPINELKKKTDSFIRRNLENVSADELIKSQNINNILKISEEEDLFGFSDKIKNIGPKEIFENITVLPSLFSHNSLFFKHIDEQAETPKEFLERIITDEYKIEIEEDDLYLNLDRTRCTEDSKLNCIIQAIFDERPVNKKIEQRYEAARIFAKNFNQIKSEVERKQKEFISKYNDPGIITKFFDFEKFEKEFELIPFSPEIESYRRYFAYPDNIQVFFYNNKLTTEFFSETVLLARSIKQYIRSGADYLNEETNRKIGFLFTDSSFKIPNYLLDSPYDLLKNYANDEAKYGNVALELASKYPNAIAALKYHKEKTIKDINELYQDKPLKL